MSVKLSSAPVLVVIPARYASTRFPGKPLHLIAGKPLVQHVWERCMECREVARVVVATDDERIATAARDFGAEVCLTRADHPSGTDRIAEVAEKYPDFPFLINVQGDEPLISPDLVDELARTLRDTPGLPMITAANPMTEEADIENPNIVKVVLTRSGDALYFSRSRLPYPRNAPLVPCYRHAGIYGYTREFVRQFVTWEPSPLEQTESLEQLRALENGARIRVVITTETSPGVDTPEQAAFVEQLLLSNS